MLRKQLADAGHELDRLVIAGQVITQLMTERLLGAGELANQVAKLQGPRNPRKTGWETPDDWLRDGEADGLRYYQPA